MGDLRVLIADDDMGMRTIMRRIVSKVEGFVLVAEAGDGRSALEGLRVIWKLYDAEHHNVVADLRDIQIC